MTISVTGGVILSGGSMTSKPIIATYRYFRINITGFQSGSIVKIADMRLIQDSIEHPTADMTSNTAPAPLIASASSSGGVGLEPFRAFDNNVSGSQWRNDGAGPPDWLKIDLGAGNELAPTSVKIVNANSAVQSPSDFTIEGSNDDSIWTILYTATGVTWATTYETKIFVF